MAHLVTGKIGRGRACTTGDGMGVIALLYPAAAFVLMDKCVERLLPPVSFFVLI